MKADIYKYKAELEAKLAAVNQVIADMGLKDVPIKAAKGLTTEQAILAVLGSGSKMTIAEIVSKAVEIKGRSIPKHNIAFHLNQLKKEKAIHSPERGCYRLSS